MRIAVVDLGSNSTRLLVADVEGGALTELERRSVVTRLGHGVDRAGRLAPEAIARVEAALGEFRTAIDGHGAETVVGVLTSAVRDAANGAEFTQTVRERYGIDAHTIPGDEEARLTFLGATSARAHPEQEVAVVDIGGGSTELVVGRAEAIDFRVSMQMGVVRFSERHIHTDPPAHAELEALTDEVRATLIAELPAAVRSSTQALVAVAGTATSAAAIAYEVEPYDPQRVHGARVSEGALEEMLARLAAMTDVARRQVPGLHPDRAPTIVAGIVILLEAARALGLDEIEVSEHDILRGVALDRARRRAGAG